MMIDTAFGPPGEDETDGGGTAPPGGASRRYTREQTRAALLDAAQRLWAQRGVHNASLDEVAAAAGLTKGAVYSNFAGKSDLLLTLLERYTAEGFGVEVHAELCDTGRPAGERFERAGRAYARRLSGDQARMLALLLVEFWLYGMRDFAAGWRVAEWYAARRARLAAHLDEVEGITPDDRAALAVALDAGLALQHLLDPERVPAELYATGMRLLLGPALS
ncbi:putative TetR-family regulatory protein [Actinomadura sp. NBRC 104425]|uniref:TetR/AcrR family transcriptional regulator n=1 Tax=Actinomadura sp. NBRC 104425 TaxID=3032204 RepID=UPI0024A04E1D|nr:TetR family transcriptional regulator [Actinomadura sp. NBRC 104425]GLZ12249.1 putative TetR-family regulatory protein [Actinomadura sp. NBRC 104425]